MVVSPLPEPSFLDRIKSGAQQMFQSAKQGIGGFFGGWDPPPERTIFPQNIKPAQGGVLAAQQAMPTPTATPTPQPMARNPAFPQYNPQQQVIDAITQAATQYGIPPELLFDIALQESSFNPGLTNTTPEGVQAGNPQGLFQFTDPTWQDVQNYAGMQGSSLQLPSNDRFDPFTNALAAAYLIKMGQLGRWDASKNVWGEFYSPEELQPYYSQTPGRK